MFFCYENACNNAGQTHIYTAYYNKRIFKSIAVLYEQKIIIIVFCFSTAYNERKLNNWLSVILINSER